MRYIDADKLITFANNHKDKMIDANDIARFPTEDVVPKSEVEKAKQEVAREIFEEIETTLKLYKKYDFRSGTYFECYLEAGITELKKKYTEGKNG